MTIDKQEGASAIRLRLDPSSGVPTYLQLVQQVERSLRLGFLLPGDQLPKVREVVAELAINPNTVLKAYRELEHKGLASGRPGAGTFIEASLTPVSLPELAALRRSLRRWLDDAAAAGLDDDGVVTLVENTLRDFPERAAPRRDAQPRTRRGGGAA
jgi:GntR family transcriptional regulator